MHEQEPQVNQLIKQHKAMFYSLYGFAYGYGKVPAYEHFDYPAISSAFMHELERGAVPLLDDYKDELKDKAMLDMGAADGIVPYVLVNLYDMSQGYGIEIRPDYVVSGNGVYEQLGETRCKLIHGNFFPDWYEVSPDIKWGGLAPETIAEVSTKKPYEVVNLKQIQLFYFFPYSQYAYHLVKLIAENATSGALILAAGGGFLNDSLKRYNAVLPANIQYLNGNENADLLLVI